MTELVHEPGPAWEECEAALDRRGSPLPLFHRPVWARAIVSSGARVSFIAVPTANANCRAGFAFESWRSRALPGHRSLSVRRLGIGSGGLDDPAIDAALAALTSYARADKSVLRITIDVFGLNPESRARTSEAVRSHGFVRVEATRTYTRTLVIDLTAEEGAILAGFSRSARRNIRNLTKYPAVVTSAESTSLAASLQQLDDETRQRTRGEQRRLDWASLIRMSAAAPHLSRIAVLKRTDGNTPNSVLAFAWGCIHGDVAEYSESGSARADDLKIPTSYALLWDLIRWARRSGAQSFDMGGVTRGTENSGDSLGGISDFKRHFSQREMEVGQQWQLEPHPARAAAARMISGGAGFLRRASSRLRSR